MVNADGEGNFFEGLQPSCPARDDLEHELGEVDEASLHEAIAVIRNGRCSTAVVTSQARAPAPVHRPRDAWSSLLGAH
jgi:hypothetical protein